MTGVCKPGPVPQALAFSRLKGLVSIRQVLEAYGLLEQLRQRGDRLEGPCPLHRGDNPAAFRVDLTRGLWRCFTRCGGGDIVELVRRQEGCGYSQAAQRLSQLACHAGPWPPHSPPAPAVSARAPFQPFVQRVSLNPDCAFLQQQKGIRADTARRFEAGLAPHSRWLAGTVAVRLHDLAGQPLGYCGRRLDPEQLRTWGKWKFPRGFPKHHVLFNAHRAAMFREGGIIVGECPWSVMRFYQAGVPGAVALLGTRLHPAAERWLAACRRVILLLDGDPAGETAGQAIARQLAPACSVAVHQLPHGLDPDDLSDPELHQLAAGYGIAISSSL